MYPPAAPKDFVKVPIMTSTSRGSTPSNEVRTEIIQVFPTVMLGDASSRGP